MSSPSVELVELGHHDLFDDVIDKAVALSAHDSLARERNLVE